MNTMHLVFLGAVLSVLLFAETAPNNNPGAATGMTSPDPSKLNPSAVQIFDKGFFDEKKEAKPAVNSNGRALAEEPDYTSDKREEWLKKCAPLKEKDGVAYRKCYQDEKAQFQGGLKKNREMVEQRQNEPLRNTNPLLEEQRKSLQMGGGDDD